MPLWHSPHEIHQKPQRNSDWREKQICRYADDGNSSSPAAFPKAEETEAETYQPDRYEYREERLTTCERGQKQRGYRERNGNDAPMLIPSPNGLGILNDKRIFLPHHDDSTNASVRGG